MKRVIFLTIVFVLAWAASAWAADADDTVNVTAHVNSYLTLVYSGTTDATITVDDTAMTDGYAMSADLNHKITTKINDGTPKVTLAESWASGTPAAWAMLAKIGSSIGWKACAGGFFSVPVGINDTNIEKYKVTGVSWSDAPGDHVCTITYTLSAS